MFVDDDDVPSKANVLGVISLATVELLLLDTSEVTCIRRDRSCVQAVIAQRWFTFTLSPDPHHEDEYILKVTNEQGEIFTQTPIANLDALALNVVMSARVAAGRSPCQP